MEENNAALESSLPMIIVNWPGKRAVSWNVNEYFSAQIVQNILSLYGSPKDLGQLQFANQPVNHSTEDE